LSIDALAALSAIGTSSSLRYALNLIAPSHLLATRRKAQTVDTEDVRLAYKYFCDVERSIKYVKETNGLMFGEEEVDRNGPAPMEI
jgi:RuvB-like protein 2